MLRRKFRGESKTRDFPDVYKKLVEQILRGRSSHRRCSVGEGVLRNFANFTGKHLCQSLFLNKVARNFYKHLF